MVKTLENIAEVVLEWEGQNVVIYNISITEAVRFSKFHRQRLNK